MRDDQRTYELTRAQSQKMLREEECPKPAFEAVQPIKVGVLEKQGKKFKTWNKRYFLLEGKYLYYYATPKDPQPRGVISLVNCTVAVEAEVSGVELC